MDETHEQCPKRMCDGGVEAYVRTVGWPTRAALYTLQYFGKGWPTRVALYTLQYFGKGWPTRVALAVVSLHAFKCNL